MRLKKLGLALFAVAALGAILASSALAAAVTQDVKWYTGAKPGTELTGSLSVTAEQEGSGTFETTVAGEKLIVSATEVECLGCSIANTGGVASGTGELKFKHVTVIKPEHCTTSENITTNPLTVQADWMKEKEVEPNYIKFVPQAGEANGFASFTLAGEKCPLKTTIIPKGSVFVQSTNPTNTQAAAQTVKSTAAINSAAGGTLHVGTEAAILTTTATFKAYKIVVKEGKEEKEFVSFGTH
jgi:hypothetical protein